jgi:hypothetical protein
MKTIALVLIFIINSTVTLAQTSSRSETITVAGVCEILDNRSFYNGKDVAIVGRWSTTDEGFWLTDKCDNQTKTGDYIWRNILALTYDPSLPSAFANGLKTNKSEIEKKINELKERLKTSNDKTAWAVVYGRVETAEELQIVEMAGGKTGKTVMPAGYGHLNAAPAQVFYKKKDLIVWQNH